MGPWVMDGPAFWPRLALTDCFSARESLLKKTMARQITLTLLEEARPILPENLACWGLPCISVFCQPLRFLHCLQINRGTMGSLHSPGHQDQLAFPCSSLTVGFIMLSTLDRYQPHSKSKIHIYYNKLSP